MDHLYAFKWEETVLATWWTVMDFFLFFYVSYIKLRIKKQQQRNENENHKTKVSLLLIKKMMWQFLLDAVLTTRN